MRRLGARSFVRSGPAVPRVVRRAGASVVAVPGRYSVSYLLVGPDAVAVADVGSHDDLPGVQAALEALDGPPRAVRYLLPTHLHFDHVLGLDPLALRLGAPVALGRAAHAHVTRGERLRFPRGFATPGFWFTMSLGWAFQGLPFPSRDDLRASREFGSPRAKDAFRAQLGPVLTDGQPLPDLPGWTVLETPGHADDALCLYHAEAGFLVTGDTVRNYLGGEWNPLVADPHAYQATKERLRTLPVTAVFPGHGPVVEGRDLLQSIREVPFYLP